MKRLVVFAILGAGIHLLATVGITVGQVRGSLGSGVRGGYGGAMNRGRSARGLPNNPIANPSPTLTPHQVFHPRGSLSPGQVANPVPSLMRPRVGVSIPTGKHIQQSAIALERRLQRLAPDNGWSDYLSLPVLRLLEASSEAPRSTEERNRLQIILSKYVAAGKNDDFRIITQMQEFQAISMALHDYLKPIRARQQGNLLFRIAQFEQTLAAYPNGERWVRYFDLIAQRTSLGHDQRDQNSSPHLIELLERFEKVRRNPKYERVSSLPAFRMVQTAAEQFLEVDSREGESSEKPDAERETPSPAYRQGTK